MNNNNNQQHVCCICNLTITQEDLTEADELINADEERLMWTCSACLVEIDLNTEDTQNEEEEDELYEDLEEDEYPCMDTYRLGYRSTA